MSDEYEINPDHLEPTIDIDLATQRKVLRLLARAKHEDHYSLLNVPPDAEKRAISNSYFSLMNELHTDKFYGKNIGTFGPHLSRLIEVLTRANDVLGRKKTRAEYDLYLTSRANTLGARTSVLPRSPSSNPAEVDVAAATVRASDLVGRTGRKAVAPIDIFPQIPRAPRTPQIDLTASSSFPARADGVPPQREPAPPTAQDASPTKQVEALTSQASSPTDYGEEISSSAPPRPRAPLGDAARRMLARKMGLRTPAAPGAKSEPPSPSPPPNREAVRSAVDANLKARYDARMGRSPAKAEKYAAMGEAATNSRDWSSAVNSYRMALQAAPDNQEILAKLNQAQMTADRELAPKFLEQAKYEEKDRRPERAARSFERAARGLNSAELYDRAAVCLLKATETDENERRKGVELARQAVQLDNRNVAYRLTLARAYDKAGMKTSALGEARRALELEPNNDEAKQLHKDLK